MLEVSFSKHNCILVTSGWLKLKRVDEADMTVCQVLFTCSTDIKGHGGTKCA